MKNDNANITDRLINFIIDILAFTLIAFITIILLKKFNPYFQVYNAENNRFIAFSLYFSYYFILEFSLSSTIDKFFTKTIIVDKTTLSRPSILKIFKDWHSTKR